MSSYLTNSPLNTKGSPETPGSNNSSSTPTSSRKTLRPFDDQSSPLKLRQSRNANFQEHLKKRRQLNSLMARGGAEGMENQFLKLDYENSLARLDKEAEKHRVNAEDIEDDNDYCHGGNWDEKTKDETDYLEQLLERDQEEIDAMTEYLDDQIRQEELKQLAEQLNLQDDSDEEEEARDEDIIMG